MSRARAGILCCLLLVTLCRARVFARSPGGHASSLGTSRWWTLTCPPAPASCVLTVRLRGRINHSRLRLFEEALRRRAHTQRSLGRSITLEIDANTHGGELFSAMEIGRLLRRESGAIKVQRGAQCSSACVFVLMGAIRRDIPPGARIGVHRPWLNDARGDALVESMTAQIVQYAEEMNVPARILDRMLATPADRMYYLTRAELADLITPP